MRKIFSVILCCFLAMLMILSTSASIVGRYSSGNIEFGNEFTLGDIDENGSFNALDSYKLKSYISGFDGEICVDAADFNADGDANAKDMMYIKACLSGQSQLSDYDNGDVIYNLTIGGNPITDFDIVYTDDFVLNEDNQTVTGSVLKTYIRILTNFKYMPEDYIGKGQSPHHIYLKRLDPFAPAEDRMNLDIEDYIYEVKNGDLYIYGTLRGLMYGAYEILENFGINFYLYSSTHIYKSRAIDLAEGTYVYHQASHVKYRGSGLFTDANNQYSFYFAHRLNGSNISANNGKTSGYLTGCLFDNAHTFLSTYKLGTGYDKLIASGADPNEIKKNIWNIYPAGVDKNGTTWQPCASQYGEGSDYSIMMKGLKLIFECYQNMGYDVSEMIALGTLRQSFSMCDNGNACTCTLCRAKMTGKTTKFRGNAATAFKESGYTGYYELDAAGTSVTFKKEYGSGLYVDFVNHAIREMQEIYPGVTLWTILYDHNIPESVRPQNGLGIMYCGHGCINHALGSGECGENTTVLGANNNLNEISAKWWADAVHEGGGQIWFWSYATNYSYSFASTPDIYELYENFHYLCQECNFDGFFMEGCGYDNNFENLKQYITVQLCWNPDSTWDDFIGYMTEFLELYYGSSEELLQYIDMQQEAGDLNPCFVTNHDRPWDFYNWEYLNENYEAMRGLLETAYEKAETKAQKHRVELLIYSCDFMGLSSAWERLYINGSASDRKLVEERYSSLYYYFVNNYEENTNEYQDDPYPLPDELDLSVIPMNLFYDNGAWRIQLVPEFAR